MAKIIQSHRKILEALNEEGSGTADCFNYLTFATIARRAQMDRQEVRRITRHLARKGWTEYGKGLWTEDGEPAGSGYKITEAGAAALAESLR